VSNEVVMNNEMVKVLEEVDVACYKVPLEDDEKISINRAGN
jgi:hypothetical protein